MTTATSGTSPKNDPAASSAVEADSSKLDTGGRAAIVQAAGDLLVLVIFVVAGMAEHRTAGDLLGMLRNLAVFGGLWVLVASSVRLYRPPTASKALSWQLFVTWIAAISVGILVRALFVGRALDRSQLVFWMVAMAFTGAMLAGWRLVYLAVAKVLGR
jgi:hypothetical protein